MTNSSASEPFSAVAPYYDQLMQSIPYLWWMHYVETLLDYFDRPAHKILDLCCGTGSLSELFALSGYEVVGVDRSAAMIEQAVRKAQQHQSGVRYYVQDAAALELGRDLRRHRKPVRQPKQHR
jgi:ubiquinone/menaquinone biosynthesis C-methylase UbiE